MSKVKQPPSPDLLAWFWTCANHASRTDQRAAYNAWRGRLRDVSERLTEESRIFGPRSPKSEARLAALAAELATLISAAPLLGGRP